MKGNRTRAFTLIEVTIVLAVIAALLTALVISFVKRLDRIAGEKEVTALKSIGAAFKEAAKQARYVPDQTSWATNVAAQLGWQVGDVLANDRDFPRIFLIDPSMQIDTNNASPLLPYSQPIKGSTVTSGGSVVRPFHPRFMILSSIGKPLPSALVSGVADASGANSFTNIWSTASGVAPAGWGWSSGTDLKIQHIDLSDLFIAITLSNADTTNVPTYGIDGHTPATVAYAPPFPPTQPRWFIRGSELRLINAGNVVEYSEIIYTSQEFTFDSGTWQAKPYLGRAVGDLNGKILQRAMDMFLAAPQNPYAQNGATRLGVYNAMVDYMESFIAWRESGYQGEGCPGPVANNSLTTPLGAARVSLSNVTDDLINP